jgi:hypothetical protein
MLWFIQNILFSISLIVVIHYLYIYFETTLTAPKVKDLIHCPKQKYKSLFDTINKNLDNNITSSSSSSSSSSGARDGGGAQEGRETRKSSSTLGIDNTEPRLYDDTRNDMKTDLKAFLRGIGLKSKSSSEMSFRPSYEMS